MNLENCKYISIKNQKRTRFVLARSSGGLGRCPKNPQGTSPLTHFRALPGPVLAGRQEKGAVATFLQHRIIRELYVNRLSRHILTADQVGCSGIPRLY